MSPQVEFSRPFRLERLGSGRERQVLVASPTERQALARRLGLAALHSLEAEVLVTGRPDLRLVSVSGSLTASLRQTCVVTLEEFDSTVEERIELQFSTDAASAEADEDEELLPDAPEPLPKEGLDLGEEVTQQLSLALDPYPRKPDAALPEAARDEDAGAFADLAAWGKRKDED